MTMDAEQVEPVWRSAPPTVAAVLVSHDGAAWLPKVLSSLAGLSYAPTAWRAVDVSSTDGSADLLRRSFGSERITYAPSGTGFGEAVRLGLAELPRTDWIWLLHDDMNVTPGVLAALLDEATAADDVAVVGPKIREWPSLRRLLEVGIGITGTGSRETGLETGEPDAGQHDWAEDVLAVNTAGMLVRRDVWDELGGLDPVLPLFADDLDFGWRVNRAGYRVRIAPSAVVFHAEASQRYLREVSAGDPARYERRRAQMFTVLANSSTRRFLWQYVRFFFGSLLRFVGQLIARYPEGAADELLAMRAVYLRPGRLKKARLARQSTAKVPHGHIAHLFPHWWLPYQHNWDVLMEMVRAAVRPETVETVGRRSHGGEGGLDDIELIESPSLWQRHPWMTAVLLFTAVALVAGRGLGFGVSGGALLPTPETAGGWWSLVLTGARDAGLPSLALAPPYVLLLAFAGTPLWFAPQMLVWVLLVLAPVLAALTAHRLGRVLSGQRPARIAWALSYGLVVAVGGTIEQGRLGTTVGLVVAPVIVNAALQLISLPQWQKALWLGIWIAVGAAFAPALFPLTLVGLAAAVVALRGAGNVRTVAVRALWASGIAAILLGPWMWERALRPWRVWWDAGMPVSADSRLVADLLSGAGPAPWWIGVTVVLLGVAALVPAATRARVGWAWGVALLGAVAAVLSQAVRFTTLSGESGVAPTTALGAGLFLGGLLAAVLLAADEVEFLPRRLVVVVTAATLVFPLLAAGFWLVRGVDDPLQDRSSAIVPAYLAEREGSTLVVDGDLETGVRYKVVADDGDRLGEEAMVRDTEDAERVREAVDHLLSAPSEADVEALLATGVSAVYMPDADEELTARVDSAPSMLPAGSESPTSRVWTIEGDSADVTRGVALWRVGLGGVQVLLWVVAVVLTAPVRRRPEPQADVEPVDDAPVGEAVIR
ncbi:MAG: glycosyltransferase [Aeromicrobium sp.]|uniref:glycosyltransferase n=1 Tax=Aeromicrobium sp. TaxID=1871063 RepID=UPI0039E5667A